jgi:hypothetical protein
LRVARLEERVARVCRERAFESFTRFLDAVEDVPVRPGDHQLDPLGLSFQLKLLWLSGYLPQLRD